MDAPLSPAPTAPQVTPARWEMLDHGIMFIRGAYAWGADLIEMVKSISLPNAWEKSTTLGGVQSWRESSTLRLAAEVHPELRDFERGFQDVVCRALNAYAIENEFAIKCAADPKGWVSQDTGYDLLRYGVGQFYKAHIDVSPRMKDQSVARRVLSVVSWPVGGFEGGGLSFPRQKVIVKPEPGSLVVFPANYVYPHESLPVTSGTKYSIVTWLY